MRVFNHEKAGHPSVRDGPVVRGIYYNQAGQKFWWIPKRWFITVRWGKKLHTGEKNGTRQNATMCKERLHQIL